MRINNQYFKLYSYYYTKTGIEVCIEESTFSDIIQSVGSGATVEIENEYIGYNLYVVKIIKESNVIRVTFVNPDLVDRISVAESNITSLIEATEAQDESISMLEDAIVELAEIIGGEE